jgi:putative membrane protein
MKIKKFITYLSLLIILLLGVSFATLNAEPVAVNYYLSTGHIPLSLLLVYALGIGILLGLLATIIPLLKLKTENRSLKKTIKKADTTLSNPSISTEP